MVSAGQPWHQVVPTMSVSCKLSERHFQSTSANVTEYAENKLPLDIVRDSAAIEPCFPPNWPEVMQS